MLDNKQPQCSTALQKQFLSPLVSFLGQLQLWSLSFSLWDPGCTFHLYILVLRQRENRAESSNFCSEIAQFLLSFKGQSWSHDQDCHQRAGTMILLQEQAQQSKAQTAVAINIFQCSYTGNTEIKPCLDISGYSKVGLFSQGTERNHLREERFPRRNLVR